jgi:protein subunit release factor B
MKLTVTAQKQAELQARLARLGIHEADLVEKFVRSRGPGGQNVNAVATAVYLKHLPTGIEVKAQQSRSQGLNRFLARRMLARRIETLQLGARSPEAVRVRKAQRQKRKRRKRALAKVRR